MFTVRFSPSCLILLLFLLAFVVFAQSAESQTPNGQTATSEAFSVLLKEVESLGNNPTERAQTVANWLQRQPPSSLSWQSQVSALPLLEAPDRVDKEDMSVRWLGRISAPADGQYIFEQLRTYHTDGKMRLWVNGDLVLDSPGAGSQENVPDFDDPAFRSIPVTLRAGTSAEFRLEYAHDMCNVAVNPFMPMGFPVAVLLWESETMEQQIVPKEVFRQPTENQPGLRGEYYANAGFARKVGDRIDDAVEFIWDRDAVFNGHSELRRQIVRSLLPRITNAAFLAEMSDGDVAELVGVNLASLLAATTATERSALIEAVTSQPQLLKAMPPKVLADHVQIIFMLPGKPHLDFLIRWSEVSEVPAFVPGTVISGWGTYIANNIAHYWRIGKCLGKAHTQELYDIIDGHLQNEDGRCNLGMTYIVVSACRDYNRLGRVVIRIDEALANTELSGDAKASWYLAKAFALETAMQPTVKPGRGLPELRLALGTAESDEMRARIQQEVVARLLSLGRDEEANGLLATQRKVTVSERQPSLENDLAVTEGFREQYSAATQHRRALTLKHYSDSVRKHQESARQKNDTGQMSRLQSVLTDFESKQQTEKK